MKRKFLLFLALAVVFFTVLTLSVSAENTHDHMGVFNFVMIDDNYHTSECGCGAVITDYHQYENHRCPCGAIHHAYKVDISKTENDSVFAYIWYYYYDDNDALIFPDEWGYELTLEYEVIISGQGEMKDFDTCILGDYPYLITLTVDEGVTNLGANFFNGKIPLESVSLPSTLKSIGENAFANCRNLNVINIPKGVSVISENAFLGCDSLTIYADCEGQPSTWDENWNPDNRPVMWSHTHAYENHYCPCGSPEPYIEKWDVSYYENNDIMAYLYPHPKYKNAYTLCLVGNGRMISWEYSNEAPWYSQYKSNIATLEIGEGITSIGANAFTYLGIGSVTIPASVTSIGDWAFYGCDSLSKMVIPASVTSIGGEAFLRCYSLKSIYIPSSVEYIYDYAFTECTSLTVYAEAESQPSNWQSRWNSTNRPVVWGHTHTPVKNLVNTGNSHTGECVCGAVSEGYHQYENHRCPCGAIHHAYKVDISKTENDSVFAYIWYYYYDDNDALIFPDEWGYELTLEYEVIISGQGEMKDFDTCILGDYPYLITLTVDEGVTNLGANFFNGKIPLESVSLPSTLKSIGENAFANCRNLNVINIPKGVSVISENAFLGCDSLTIYADCEGQPSTWDENWNPDNRPVVWKEFNKTSCLEKIFTFKGYSFDKTGSIAVGFEINFEAKAIYEEKTGEILEIGVVFAGYESLCGSLPLDNQGSTVKLNDGMVLKRDLTALKYTSYDFILTDITENHYDTKLVIASYINNKSQTWYIQENGISDTVEGVSYNEAKSSTDSVTVEKGTVSTDVKDTLF